MADSSTSTYDKNPIRYEFTPEILEAIQKALPEPTELRVIPWAKGYAVARDGFVISIRKHNRDPNAVFRVLKTMKHSGGYPQVNLTLEKRKSRICRIHNLVAELYLGPKPDEAYEVRHRDGNPENNAASNLLWGTHQQNMEDCKEHGTRTEGEKNGHAKVTEVEVKRIRRLADYAIPMSVIAAVFELTVSSTAEIVTRKTWRHVS